MPAPLALGLAALAAADWPAARAHLSAALQVEDTPEAQDALGLALWWLNDIPAAHEHRTRAYLLYKQRGDFPRAARLAAWLAREQVFLRANSAAMRGWFARAERLLEQTGPCLEAGWVSMYSATMTAPPAELEAAALAALAAARQYADPGLEVFALAVLGLARVALARVPEGLAAIDEAMAAATSGEVTDHAAVTETFCFTLSACELAGDLDRTDHWCQAALDYAQRHHSPFLSAYCRTTYGALLAARGQWPAAEDTLTAAIHAFDAGHQALRVHAVLKLADLRVSQGRLEEAEVLLAGYEDHSEAVLPLARLHVARGEPALARALLDQALQSSLDAPLHRVPLLRLRVEVLLAAADMPAAREAAGELASVASAANSDLLLAQADLAHGQVLRASGDAAAPAAFQQALQRLHAYEASLLAARAKLELARTLQAADPPGALMWARAALAGFERLGAARDADAAAALLRQLGAPGRARETPSAPRGSAALSPREEEVLQLLARGLTNKDIAARLVISPKTAEHHVSQILSKLGLRSRAEAAAYLARRPGPE